VGHEDEKIVREATSLANKINKAKLYTHAIGVLTGPTNNKFVFALRALGFIDCFSIADSIHVHEPGSDDAFHLLA
jgi:hypothetical protein